MATLDHTARVAPAIAADLGPGERLVVATPIQLTSGGDRSERPTTPVAPDERGALRRGAEGTADAALSFATNTSPFKGPDVDRWLNGVGITGPYDSIARRTAALLGRAMWTYVAVTDRRLVLVVQHGNSPRDYRYETIGSVDRAQLRGAEHKPKSLTRGRVVLSFVDGSTLAVQTRPQLTSSLAKPFVHAVLG